MDWTTLLNSLATNPAVQAAILGVVVKLATSAWSSFATTTDTTNAADKYQAPLHLITILASGLAALAQMALDHKLTTADPTVFVNFVTVTLPVYLAAMGIGPAAAATKNSAKVVAEKLGKKE